MGGAYACEITGGGYVRQQASLRLPSGRATWSVSPMAFVPLPATLVSQVGFWDAVTNGNFLAASPLPTVRRILAGGRYDLNAEDLALSFD